MRCDHLKDAQRDPLDRRDPRRARGDPPGRRRARRAGAARARPPRVHPARRDAGAVPLRRARLVRAVGVRRARALDPRRRRRSAGAALGAARRRGGRQAPAARAAAELVRLRPPEGRPDLRDRRPQRGQHGHRGVLGQHPLHARQLRPAAADRVPRPRPRRQRALGPGAAHHPRLVLRLGVGLSSGAAPAARPDDPPVAAVEVHVVAEHLPRPLVRVVVQRLAGVGDLAPAVAPPERAEQPRADALARHRRALRVDGRPRRRALAVTDGLALRVALEDVDRLPLGVEQHRAEVRAGEDDLRAGLRGGFGLGRDAGGGGGRVGVGVVAACSSSPPQPAAGAARRISASRTIRAPQAVADAAHGLQRRRAVAELAPQARDGDLDDVGAAGPLVAPDVAQQRLARDRLVLAVAQVAQQVALELGERDAAAVEHELARVGVERVGLDRAGRARRARTASRRPTRGRGRRRSAGRARRRRARRRARPAARSKPSGASCASASSPRVDE